MKVILSRGPLPMKVFPDEPEARAQKRAKALCDLHRCQATVTANTIIVHADNWYSSKGNDV